MAVTMDINQVEGKLKELIAGREDYIYTRVEHPTYGTVCLNWVEENGKRVGSCLVGKFYESTVGLDVIPPQGDGWSAHTLNDFVQDHTALNLDEVAEEYLQYVQSFQDQGIPWGTALVRARAEVGL